MAANGQIRKDRRSLSWISWNHLSIKIFQYVFENIEHKLEPFPWQLTKCSLLEKSWQYLLNNFMNDVWHVRLSRSERCKQRNVYFRFSIKTMTRSVTVTYQCWQNIFYHVCCDNALHIFKTHKFGVLFWFIEASQRRHVSQKIKKPRITP